jgi:putative membrane protein
MIVATGTVLVLFSAFCFLAGVWRNLNPGAPPPPPDARQLPRFVLVAINGFLTLVALLLVLMVELMNTAIEKLADRVSRN